MNKLNIDINNIKKKFKDKLLNTGWEDIFYPFIDSNLFQEIIYKLKNEVENDRRFTPKLSEIFRSFEECPLNKLKVIFIGQDPYPQLGVADGIAFSCSKTGKLQPSLKYIFKELYDAKYIEDKYLNKFDPDLTRWANQGVLMLNTAFTVQINKIGTHYNLWKPFTHHVLQNINRVKKNIPVALLGKKAEEWQIRLDNQIIMNVAHPASAAYRGGNWDSKDLFININKTLKDQGKTLITW